jgi:4-amino-4-deoxy-L-arabinose transferase-like glycosyltransferase
MTGERAGAVALLIGCAALFFWGLGSVPLFDVDEAVFAEATREMLVTGDWITPQYNGADRFDKPILFYWLMASAFAVFGVSEFGARFWSAAFGVALVALILVFAWRRLGPRAGLLSGLVAATSLEVVVLAHSAITDMVLIFFITAGLLAWFSAVQASDPRARVDAALVGAAALALAVLTKGPVGIVLPGLILGVFLALRGGMREALTGLPWGRMLVVFLLVAGPWYALELQARGWSFVEGFLLKHNVRRFTGVISGHAGPVYYYLPVVAVGLFPWTAFALPALRWAWPSGWWGLRRPTDREALALLLLVWAGVVFAFFSAAGTKLPNYVASLYPPLALLVGMWAERFVARAPGADRWVGAGVLVLVSAALLVAIAFGGLPWWLEWARERFPKAAYLHQAIDVGWGPTVLGATVLVGAAAIAWLARQRRPVATIGAIAATTVLAVGVLLTAVAPVAASVIQVPLRDMAVRASLEAGPDGGIAVYGLNKPSIVFYAKRLVTVVGESRPQELAALLAQDRKWMVITKSAWVERLNGVAQVHAIESRGGYVLASNRAGSDGTPSAVTETRTDGFR